MPIVFQKQIKKQKNLIFIFLALVLITVFIIWRGRYVEQEPQEELIPTQFKKIKINLDIFKNPLLGELQLIEKIPEFEGEIGRENPFMPY